MGTWILLIGLWAQAGDLPDREVTLMMHERFAYATMLRTSLIHGFLDRGLRHAGQLEEALDNMSSPALVAAVGATTGAETLEAAALGAARIAESCGACHQDNEVRVLIQSGQSAPWQGLRMPSIQPKQRATSRDSGQVSVGSPVALRK
ncbi:MAG: hypothetical protein AAGE01_02215 [Pseudomonadota bacterium]